MVLNDVAVVQMHSTAKYGQPGVDDLELRVVEGG